ncbi:MAG: hypothetical protein ACREBV_00995 [Candidatus Zixiibacteriota bacterium]
MKRDYKIALTCLWSGLIIIGALLAGSCAKKVESGMAKKVAELIQAYNDQKAELYWSHFSDAFKKRLSLEALSGILNSNMEKYGPIENYVLNISPGGRRGLVFLKLENADFDVHIRLNDSSQVERLIWFPHKTDPSEETLTLDNTAEYRKLYKPIADQIVKGIRDTNFELILPLLAETEFDSSRVQENRDFLYELNSPGKITGVGEMDVIAPTEIMLPVFFETADLSFYLHFDKNNRITDFNISNYAKPESDGKTLADLGADSLRTLELSHFSKLEEAFQRDSGKVRLIALLSPT